MVVGRVVVSILGLLRARASLIGQARGVVRFGRLSSGRGWRKEKELTQQSKIEKNELFSGAPAGSPTDSKVNR